MQYLSVRRLLRRRSRRRFSEVSPRKHDLVRLADEAAMINVDRMDREPVETVV